MRRRYAFRILLLTTSVAALGGGRTLAADAPDAASEPGGEAQVGELVVTAEKREERLQDVPMSVNAVSGIELRAKGVTEVADLDKVVPGFTFRPSNFGTPVYTIRGVGFFENSVAVAPAVSVYVDQIPLPYSVMTEGAGTDLERVEVLKGPQGTLFGQNATGGAINYIAAKPTSAFAAGADVGYGNFNAVHADEFISGPVADQVTARLAVSTDQRGDWQRSTTRDAALGERNFTDGRLIVDWRPSNTLFVEFNFNGWIDKSDTQAAQFVEFSAIKPTGYKDVVPLFAAQKPAPNDDTAADWDANTSFRRNDNFYQGSVHADWDITPDLTLTSLTAYSGLHQVAPTDSDGTPIVNQFRTLHTDIHSVYQELRLSGASDQDRLKWMVGLNYGEDLARDRQATVTDATNNGIGALRWHDYLVRNDQDVETKAGFGSIDYKVTSTLTAQASVRYTSSDNNFTGCLMDSGDGQLAAAFSQIAAHPIAPGSCVTLTPPPDRIPVPVVQKSLNEDNVSWRAGLSWKPDPDKMIYATVTKGYKAGSFPTVAALTPDQFDPIKQESVLAYEAGFKSTFFDRTLQLDAAVFYYDYRDKQLIGYKTTAFGNLPGFISIPRSQVPGAEADVVWRPTEPLAVSFGVSYVDPKVTRPLLTNDPFGNVVNINGEAFPNTPKWHLIGDFQYTAALTDGWRWFAGAGAQYRSATTAAFAGGPLFNINGYALLDLRAGVESENRRWRLTAWGYNVTDQFYVTNISHVVDAIARVTGMPATYGLTLGYRY